jgi:hypothetical protein
MLKVYLYLENSHHFSAPVRQVAATHHHRCNSQEQHGANWYNDQGKHWQRKTTVFLSIATPESTYGEIYGKCGKLKLIVFYRVFKVHTAV